MKFLSLSFSGFLCAVVATADCPPIKTISSYQCEIDGKKTPLQVLRRFENGVTILTINGREMIADGVSHPQVVSLADVELQSSYQLTCTETQLRSTGLSMMFRNGRHSELRSSAQWTFDAAGNLSVETMMILQQENLPEQRLQINYTCSEVKE